MHQPTRRARKIGAVVATPVAILAAGAMIWQSSNAAFTGTTRNSGNNWSTGSVALTDDDAGAARFQAEDMVPGDTETKCITVTANTTVPGVVKGYAVNPIFSAAGLENYVKLSVTYGTGGGFGSCDGFVEEGVAISENSLATIAQGNSYATGGGDWAVTAGTQSRTYKATWTFDTTGLTQSELNGLQGAQAGLDLQWELQSD